MLPCPLNGGGAGPDGNAVPVLNLSGDVVGLAARVSFKHSRGSRRRTKRGDESTAVEVRPTQNVQGYNPRRRPCRGTMYWLGDSAVLGRRACERVTDDRLLGDLEEVYARALA